MIRPFYALILNPSPSGRRTCKTSLSLWERAGVRAIALTYHSHENRNPDIAEIGWIPDQVGNDSAMVGDDRTSGAIEISKRGKNCNHNAKRLYCIPNGDLYLLLKRGSIVRE